MEKILDIGPGIIIILIILIVGLIAFMALNICACKEWICPKKKPSPIIRQFVFSSDNDDISITEYDDHRLISDKNIYEDDDDLYYA